MSQSHSRNEPQTAGGIRQSLGAFKAVAWGFFGVRRRAGHQGDIAQLSAAQVIFAALVAAAIFIGTLLGVVSLVV